MIKKFIEPLQRVLIQKKLCPACTRPLDKAAHNETRRNGTTIVTCECGRIFVHDKSLEIYRRALESEL